MGYLTPKFDHDVFVSYSHGDPDGVGDSPLKTWSQELVKALVKDVKAIDPKFRNIDIWYDAALDPTRELENELRVRASRSAILMIIMSPHYLLSSWCGKERTWFTSQIPDKKSDSGRVFVVRAISTNERDWPDTLRDEGGNPTIGFLFHDAPPDLDTPVVPHGWPDLIAKNEPFRRELNRLRTILMKRLRELHSAQSSGTTQAEGVASPHPKLYLHSRPEEGRLRDDIESKLRLKGFDVIAPPHGDRTAAIAEDRIRAEHVQNSDALLLVNGRPAQEFVGDLFQIGVAERGQAAAKRRSRLPCAVLDGARQELPDLGEFGIERIDLLRQSWPDDLVTWFTSNRTTAGSVRP